METTAAEYLELERLYTTKPDAWLLLVFVLAVGYLLWGWLTGGG